MRKFFLFFAVAILFSFSDTSLKKRISDQQFRYEFYTTDKEVFAEPDRYYFWFRGGAIHSSENGIGGELLHSDFLKFYLSNQLAESGKFKNGLKEGYWKTWFPNGVLHSKTYWSDGQMDGSYYGYDETGFMVEEGKFKNHRKHGRWINYISKDTLKYKDGKVVVPKVKPVKDTLQQKKEGNFFKRLFSRKKKEGKEEAAERPAKNKSAKKPVAEKKETPAKADEKPGFFKRIFSKKKKTTTDGKS
ncbi:hypothetical protein AAEO56_11675 [Flavobacterium sp. DGU11]|uniref:MORN repeat variant n=1 Tax=Flavobacterium arundinis TaxID=3139143 RepID=A0ABU9HXM8_9FLAO